MIKTNDDGTPKRQGVAGPGYPSIVQKGSQVWPIVPTRIDNGPFKVIDLLSNGDHSSSEIVLTLQNMSLHAFFIDCRESHVLTFCRQIHQCKCAKM